MQGTHGLVGVPDVVVGDHDKTAVLALGVDGTDLPKGREQGPELVLLNVAVDVAHEQGARRMLAKGVLGVVRHARGAGTDGREGCRARGSRVEGRGAGVGRESGIDFGRERVRAETPVGVGQGRENGVGRHEKGGRSVPTAGGRVDGRIEGRGGLGGRRGTNRGGVQS